MEIKIRSMKLIKPSKSTPENLRNFELSFLDQLVPPSYINIVLYYKASGKVNNSDRCSKLVKSLSEVLTLFRPLAGRIDDDGLTVDCNDEGVEYVEAQVSTRLDDFLEQGPKTELIDQLIGAQDQIKTALVRVQVNIFDCGGLVIGVSASHKVTDTFNLVRFINGWASTNREASSNGAFSPCFGNLASLFPTRDVSSIDYSLPEYKQGTRIVTKRFVFDGTSISKLRAKASSRNEKHSRVVLVASLLWRALIIIDQVKSGGLRDCLLAPAMNLRGKVGLPVSENSFGNVWAPYSVWFLQKEMKLRPEFVDLVALLEDTTRNVIMDLAKASSEDICRKAIDCYAEVIEELKQNKFCICTSWCRFPIYDADFGWGKPSWASGASGSMEMVALMDDEHGDGIEAWVSLDERDMSVFENDQDILAFTS